MRNETLVVRAVTLFLGPQVRELTTLDLVHFEIMLRKSEQPCYDAF
jgi:hypothetical protein